MCYRLRPGTLRSGCSPLPLLLSQARCSPGDKGTVGQWSQGTSATLPRMSATATWETLTSLVESLAWPLIALAALLTLRPSIKVLINNLDKIRHRDTEFRFKKTSVDLEEHTDPRPLTPLGLVRPPSSITKFYGYLNYKGGNSNFWAFGIRTGYTLKVTAYPFRELSNRSCYLLPKRQTGPRPSRDAQRNND